MTKKILLVDDEEINLVILESILRDLDQLSNYQIKGMENSRVALDFVVEDDDVDIILLDLNMPELSGFTFIQEYDQRKKKENRANIIVISAEEDPYVISSCFDLGVDDFITKPFEKIVVQSRIKNVLEKRNLFQEIQRQNKSNQTLIRVLIHDVNNPLSVAMYASEKYGEKKDDLYLQKLNFALHNIEEITSNVKTLVALDSEKKTLDLAPCKMNDILKECIHLSKEKLDAKKIKVFCEDKSIKGMVMVNRPVFKHQILLNILSNAIKFSPEGEKIEVRIEEGRGDELKLEIRDYGIGIPKELLPKLFQWDVKTSREGTKGEFGTGFGLPIVKRFVDHLNGQIQIKSPILSDEKGDFGTSVILSLKTP